MPIQGAALNSSLDLFVVPPTDYSTASARWVKISPSTASVTPIQFYIDKQADLIDLRRSYFEWELQFKQVDGGDLDAAINADHAPTLRGLVNNIPHSLIKQFLLKCNGTLLTEQIDMYHHKAMLQTLLNYNRQDGDTILQATNGLWRNVIDNPDTYTATNIVAPGAVARVTANSGNGNHDNRANLLQQTPGTDDYVALSDNHKQSILAQKKEARDLWSGTKKQTLRMKPFSEIFHTDKWIVPNTSFEFQFWLNPSEVWSNNIGGAANANIRALTTDDCKVTFHMCLVKVNPSVYMHMMSALNKSMALYPLVRAEIRQYPLENGATYKEILNPFSNRVPQRFVVVVVDQTAFNGERHKEPFAYQKAGIEFIKQMVNGEEYPYETMNLNPNNGEKDYGGYFRFLEATGCLERNDGNMIRFLDWGQGKNATLFVFSNIASGQQDSPIIHPKSQAHIDLHIKCAAQTSAKTIMIMAEYETVIRINSVKSATFMSVE